jgi:hypothetical protein
MNNKLFMAVMLAIAILFVALTALAGSVTFADVCQPAKYVQRGADLLIYCPNQVAPWLTFRGCKGARVTWDRTQTKIKVVCQ